MTVFTDERGVRINVEVVGIARWHGNRTAPAFPGCTNAIICAHVFLTLMDSKACVLRDLEAERFLDWVEQGGLAS